MNAWFEAMTGLSLLHPGLLAFAALIPLALALRWRRGAPAVRFSPASLLGQRGGSRGAAASVPAQAPLPRSWRVRLHRLPTVLHVLGVAAAVLALARPVQRTLLPFRSEGIDVVLCLDVSSSMAATDLDPERHRLEVAKDAAARFVQGRPDDRIGLLTFARYPDLRCPPTLDHRALTAILDGVEMVASDGQEDATGIGAALARAAQVLQHGAAKSKVLVLLTDGEETVATTQTADEIAPLHAAQLCRELSVRAYAIAAGIGTRAADGAWAPLDTSVLERVASTTGGRFFAARDASAVGSVYREIDELERQEQAQPRYRVEQRFMPFLVAAIVLVVLARVLRHMWLKVVP